MLLLHISGPHVLDLPADRFVEREIHRDHTSTAASR